MLKPMTLSGMVRLRLAATVAHALPGVGLRIRNGTRTVLEVTSAPSSPPEKMSPCAFRMTVAGAHQLAHTTPWSTPIRFLCGEDLALDIRVSSGDRIWPSSTYRIGIGGGYVHGFATTLAPHHCRRLIARRATTVSTLLDLSAIRLYRDTATEVTLVHVVTPATPAADLRGVLEGLLAQAVADEVVSELGGAARP